LALKSIKLNNELMSKIISHPIAKYSKRDINSYLPVKNNFFKVPKMDKVSTTTNMLMPE
tara:strand:+ start:1287 stop:1463 length:177 start_codon:yes stop_codon:yes gene_type:complete